MLAPESFKNSESGFIWPCEKCPNTEVFLVRIFPHSDWLRRDTPYLRISPYSVRMWENMDQKKLCMWTLFTQFELDSLHGKDFSSFFCSYLISVDQCVIIFRDYICYYLWISTFSLESTHFLHFSELFCIFHKTMSLTCFNNNPNLNKESLWL